jgi:hypothetical protein
MRHHIVQENSNHRLDLFSILTHYKTKRSTQNILLQFENMSIAMFFYNTQVQFGIIRAVCMYWTIDACIVRKWHLSYVMLLYTPFILSQRFLWIKHDSCCHSHSEGFSNMLVISMNESEWISNNLVRQCIIRQCGNGASHSHCVTVKKNWMCYP